MLDDIRRQDVPAWYELSIEGTNLIIAVHDTAMNFLRKIGHMGNGFIFQRIYRLLLN